MKAFTYYSPTEIVFGKGTEGKAGELVKKYGGKRVLLIYGGNSAVKSGLKDRVEKSLTDAGLAVHSEGGVIANPLLSRAEEILAAGRSFEADFVLPVGGGSVIDTAKSVALAMADPEAKIWDYWEKKRDMTACLPLGCVLTISAAGSETSNSMVLTDDLKVPPTKRAINNDVLRCKFAIMDPDLTMTLPKYQIGAGTADIFMHTAERYFTKILGNHMTDEIAEGLFRNIIKYGPIGVEDPQDYEAMSEIMWTGSVSHIGLTGLGAKGDTPRDGDWSCHQLGMALSALYNSTHGATLSAVWASWARYVRETNIARFGQFARNVFGITEPDDMKASELAIWKVNEFFTSLGMPVSITELLGRRPDDDELVKLTVECTYDCTRTIGTFQVLGYDDILEIYRNAR
ncbi:MAG: iron-containing alcohol dehydrogenase [Lachnospiraceae bacterium]|nr:iron-containing alcohol dehydrogenase [Lachnospiraceae bacterium]